MHDTADHDSRFGVSSLQSHMAEEAKLSSGYPPVQHRPHIVSSESYLGTLETHRDALWNIFKLDLFFHQLGRVFYRALPSLGHARVCRAPYLCP